MTESHVTIPPEFEQYARSRALRIAAIDRNRLPGSNEQFTSVVQLALVDAIRKSLGAAIDACELVRVTLRGDTIAEIVDVQAAIDIACSGCIGAISDMGGSDFSPVAMGITPNRPYVTIRSHGVEFSPAMPITEPEMAVLRQISQRMTR